MGLGKWLSYNIPEGFIPDKEKLCVTEAVMHIFQKYWLSADKESAVVM